MIQSERINSLNNRGLNNNNHLFYWMQASQRTEYNHALEFALKRANNLGQPLTVFFILTDSFPEANSRHYRFMLEGLKKVKEKLAERNIRFLLFYGNPIETIVEIAEKASLIITDMDYLKETRSWRKEIAKKIKCPFLQVESNSVVPVKEASKKEEYAAYTIRKKIQKKLDYYLKPVDRRKAEIPSSSTSLKLPENLKKIELSHYLSAKECGINKLMERLDIDRSVKPVDSFKGGEDRAEELLYHFITAKLDKYHKLSNDPTKDYLSQLSPYIHFGQISPLLIALEVMDRYSPGQNDFIDQLIIRRELSLNFVYYNQNYDRDLEKILPEWAYESLMIHRSDPRDFIYSREEFESASTHDKYWNAAQREMMITGKMHSYMRMYWAKKILEWSQTPEKAFAITLYLNNKYSLDGRDPNSFAGTAWCFGKHDRAWAERPVFGKTRYMNANGLKRKFAADLYLDQINKLEV